MRQNKYLAGAGIATSLVTLGSIALGAFLATRHRNRGEGDAPEYTRRRTVSGDALTGRTVTIRRPRKELFKFWRDFSNLSHFMENLESVKSVDGTNASVWRIKAPMGRTVDVETQITSETKNEEISWRSTDNSDVRTEGKVSFDDAPGDRGTRVRLEISYDPPAGSAGRKLAKLFLREPEQQARHDLKRFKMLMETGEIATSARTRDETRAAKQEKE